MLLQTHLSFEKQKHNTIEYNSKLFLVGSCFTENIGRKLDYFKFQNNLNPFGILFQPLAIEALITNAINEKIYTLEDLFFHNEQWHCFDMHSSLSNTSDVDMLQILNDQIKNTREHLETASHLVITLGTAWVYRFIETDSVVANCHKVPQKKFLKELLSVDVLSETLESIVSLVKSINSNISIIFTVSPVRHLKDGFIENTQSKAHLIAAIHAIINPKEHLHYFPSYEIMMDELRDYRYYAEDMIHPNLTAINYIWEKFQETWISEETASTMENISSIQKGIMHRPFNSNSEAHQQFLQKLNDEKERLQLEFPHIEF